MPVRNASNKLQNTPLPILQNMYPRIHFRFHRHRRQLDHPLNMPRRVNDCYVLKCCTIFSGQQCKQCTSQLDLRRVFHIKSIPINDASPRLVSNRHDHIVHVFQNTLHIIIPLRFRRMHIKNNESTLFRYLFKRMTCRIRRTRRTNLLHPLCSIHFLCSSFIRLYNVDP